VELFNGSSISVWDTSPVLELQEAAAVRLDGFPLVPVERTEFCDGKLLV
jgi:hypothetical protein